MQTDKEHRILEIFLIITVVGLAALLFRTAGFKMVVLNLFYLPVVLAGFFLGRYRAGILCLLCIVLASIVTVLDMQQFAAMRSPVAIGLAVTVWGAVLGLTSILVGTLSDERNNRIDELNDAYVGIIEVLSQYLQSANAEMQATSSRVAETSYAVGEELGLPPHALDDIRVAALLHDFENLEITARVIRRAVGSIEEHQATTTFHGIDLTQSLGSVMTRAFPLMMASDHSNHETGPLGARIIRTVRAYEQLVCVGHAVGHDEAIELLRHDSVGGYDATVLSALQRCLQRMPPQEQSSVSVIA